MFLSIRQQAHEKLRGFRASLVKDVFLHCVGCATWAKVMKCHRGSRTTISFALWGIPLGLRKSAFTTEARKSRKFENERYGTSPMFLSIRQQPHETVPVFRASVVNNVFLHCPGCTALACFVSTASRPIRNCVSRASVVNNVFLHCPGFTALACFVSTASRPIKNSVYSVLPW